MTQLETNYRLLPFQFMRLGGRTLVVNQAGECYVLPDTDFQRFTTHALEASDAHFLNLKAKHFLADSDLALPVQLLATKYRTKKSFLRNFTALHMFVLTLRCNQKCSYCQVCSEGADASRFDMQPETARRAVEVAFQSPSSHIKIEFQGGEPFLNFRVMQQIVEQAKALNGDHKKHLEFVACTNLVSVTDEQLLYCKANQILISTSLDGPREIHNACRSMESGKGSYDRAVEGIARARAIVGENQVDSLMTTTRASLGHVHEIVDEYVNQGFRSIFLRSLNPFGRARATSSRYEVTEFVSFYREGLDYIIGLNVSGVPIAEQYARIVLTRMLTPFSTGFVDLQSPTGAGIGCAIYDYDGSVYVSDEGRMLGRIGDTTFRMGSVLRDDYRALFGGEVIRRMVGASCVECLPECVDCAFRMWCGADPVRNYATQGDMVGHRPSSEVCRKNQAIIRYLLDAVAMEEPQVLDVFWAWITNRSVAEVRFIGRKGGECAR